MGFISDKELPPGEEPPRIEFPCDYPIKIIGDAADDFIDVVLAIILRHVVDFDSSTVSSRASSKGRFCAVTVIIRATGEEQLVALHSDLKASGRVKMVL